MTDQVYWKKHYVIETNADEIERSLAHKIFSSEKKKFELLCFYKNRETTNILISPGSAGHSYVFAELAYHIHIRGYNVFIMPKHGGVTINELMKRHEDATRYISADYNDRIGVFAEGLGGFASFYLTLGNGLVKSAVYMNAPVIMTEKKFWDAWKEGNSMAVRRKMFFPFAKFIYKIFPGMRLPIRLYLDFKKMVDPKEENRKIEGPLVERYYNDPDFDRKYPLSAIMSLITTEPPKPLSALKVPTMFLVPARGLFPSYEKDLFDRLPDIRKKILEVDGSVFWMVSHPREAAGVICEWFEKTM